MSSPSHSTRPSAPTRAACPRSRWARRADHGPAIARRTPGAARAMASIAVRGVLVGLDRPRVEDVRALERPALGRGRRGRAPRHHAQPRPGRRRAMRATSNAVSADGVSTSRAWRRRRRKRRYARAWAARPGPREVLAREAGRDEVVAGHHREPGRDQGGLDGVEDAARREPPRGALADRRRPGVGEAVQGPPRPRHRGGSRSPPAPAGRGAPGARGARPPAAPPGRRSSPARRCRCPGPRVRPTAASRRAGPGRASDREAYSVLSARP